MPKPKKAPLVASCQECGAAFNVGRSPRFCTTAHKVAWQNRMSARGRVMAPYVLAWIAGKGGGHRAADATAMRAMRELTQIARGYIDEDAEANEGRGRPSCLDYMASVFAEGFLHCDRPRPRRRKADPKPA